MTNVFKIAKHIKEWEDNQNLYKRISGELTDEAINWYKNRTIAQIWESCILTWNKNHFKSCKSVTELETCFLERGIDNLKRELFGCLYITMPNLRYMVQVFSENRTTGEICDYEAEEKAYKNAYRTHPDRHTAEYTAMDIHNPVDRQRLVVVVCDLVLCCGSLRNMCAVSIPQEHQISVS